MRFQTAKEAAGLGVLRLFYILFDDATFAIIERDIFVTLGVYTKLYESLLVNREYTDVVGVILQEAINLYFDYLSDDGMLACIVKENLGKDDYSLICLLLEKSENYGLSDVQAKELIKKRR